MVCAYFILLVSSLFANSYTDIEDTSHLPFLSPDLKQKEIAKIALANGLEILLISDPNANQSAATVAVQAGSWSDPLEYPGMAHFCEHMLFMGTEKYPDSNEFSSLVSNFNGLTNAFTAADKTVYMFSCLENGFLPLLDRFAHFFIDPIFDPSNISKELHAVDQEFALMKENDSWRKHMVLKETGNQDHPNRLFSAGNSKTLSKIPQSALKKWHQAHYGSNRMRVALYSSLPLNDLKNAAEESFRNVPAISSIPSDFNSHLTDASQKKQIISIAPIKNIHILSLSWELPPHLIDDAQAADLIAYTLKRGGAHSLLQNLKNGQLIDEMRIQVQSYAGKNHPFFEIDIALSNLGIQNTEQVMTRVFQALKGLKETNIPETMFFEKNALAKLNYQYQTRTDAFQFISQIGRSILDEELASFPRKTLLASAYDREKIRQTLDFLTFSECVITLMTPEKISHANKEEWLGVPYTIQPIPLEWIASWENTSINPDIRLADPNPFVPSHLDSVPDPGLGEIPVCIAASAFGKAFYIRCNEYQAPESAIHLHIATEQLQPTAKSYVLGSLYLDHLTDQLNPILIDAENSHLSSRFAIDENKIHITLSGFSEKIPLLLQEILKQMPMQAPTKEQFALYVARHIKEYENSTKIIPVKQAKELLSTLINRDKTTKQENLRALQEISFEDFLSFHKNLFEKTYFEALFAGNLTLKTAESCWIDILHALSQAPYPKNEHPPLKTLHLPTDEGPFYISKETSAQGNAAILLIDEGDFSFEKKATQKILSAALQEPFFDTLRTKQKTGYIAQSSDAEFEKRLYQYFLVQSNTHQPEDLLHRFELFLEEFRENFSHLISENRFETLKQSAIATLKTQCHNLREKSTLWDLLAFQEKENFSLIEQRIDALEHLSYEQFAKNSHAFLSRENRKRLAILYTGKIPAPFAYSPMDVSDLSKVASYKPREESK